MTFHEWLIDKLTQWWDFWDWFDTIPIEYFIAYLVCIAITVVGASCSKKWWVKLFFILWGITGIIAMYINRG